METKINNNMLELIQCNITEQTRDAIINPANTALQMGGGVAGAIRRRGGPTIQQECNKIGGTNVGGAVITTGGNLHAKYLIHAIGPVYGDDHEDEKLKNATLNSLKLADKTRLKSITFPAISTGIFGFPKDRCATIMLSTTVAYLDGPTGIEKVVYCLYDNKTLNLFERTLQSLIQSR